MKKQKRAIPAALLALCLLLAACGDKQSGGPAEAPAAAAYTSELSALDLGAFLFFHKIILLAAGFRRLGMARRITGKSYITRGKLLTNSYKRAGSGHRDSRCFGKVSMLL